MAVLRWLILSDTSWYRAVPGNPVTASTALLYQMSKCVLRNLDYITTLSASSYAKTVPVINSHVYVTQE